MIENLGDRGAEFLVAAGVEDMVSLAKSEALLLHQEMEGANAILAIDKVAPSVAMIGEWIESARRISGIEVSEAVVKLVEEAVEPEIEVLEAIPISPKVLVDQEISVRDVPPMEMFLEDGLELAPRKVEEVAPPRTVGVRDRTPTPAPAPVEVNKSEEKQAERAVVQPLQKNSVRDIRKTPSAELNAGKKLHSRSYIRGVLHPQPFKVRVAALISVITLLLFPATFVAGALMMMKMTIWLSVIPAAFLLFGLLYLMNARGMKCRICGQPLFAPKACHRHVKAHRIPILGYILPTSLHILLFHWFRCMYCGTSVRIKE